MNEREQAFVALEQMATGRAAAAPAVDSDAVFVRDANFVRTIVLGVIRWQSRLDYAIEKVSGRSLRAIDARALTLLRIGFYQLMFMDVPPYAAVDATVEVAARRHRRAKAFVNAVLRRATERNLHSIVPEGEGTSAVAIRLAHPEWMLRRWEQRWGVERARAIAAANQELSYPDLLVGPKWSREAAVARLRELALPFEASPLFDDVLRLRGGTAAIRPEIGAGMAYPIDEGSVAVARFVPPEIGEMLDLAAAPGGKSLVLAVDGRGVVSNDVSFERLLLLRSTFPAVTGRSPRLLVSDARSGALRRRFEGVLLDAPCSATGTIRKNPEVKWRLDERAIARYARMQRELLASALDLTASWCIYSTCSLEGEENDEVVQEVVRSRDDFRIEEPSEWIDGKLRPAIEGGALRLTADGGTDGFTVFALRRLR